MYRTFIRSWYKWENGRLVPAFGARQTPTGHYKTEQEAREACENYNASHNPGNLSRKMEYTNMRRK